MERKIWSGFVSIIIAVSIGALLTLIVWLAYTYYRNLLLVGLTVIAAAAAFIVIRSNIVKRGGVDLELNELERIRHEETHPLFYYEIVKYVFVLNDEGKAKVDYRMECKNTSESPLLQIKHEINYDGIVEAFTAIVNDKDCTSNMRNKTFYKEEIRDGKRINVKMPYTLRILFELEREKIEAHEDFDYGYCFESAGLYPERKKKGVEYSGVHINHPTQLLATSVELPRGMRFVPTGVYVRVIDKHEVIDRYEEERCRKLFPHRISYNGRRVIWEIAWPKIACSYRFYFQTE